MLKNCLKYKQIITALQCQYIDLHVESKWRGKNFAYCCSMLCCCSYNNWTTSHCITSLLNSRLMFQGTEILLLKQTQIYFNFYHRSYFPTVLFLISSRQPLPPSVCHMANLQIHILLNIMIHNNVTLC